MGSVEQPLEMMNASSKGLLVYTKRPRKATLRLDDINARADKAREAILQKSSASLTPGVPDKAPSIPPENNEGKQQENGEKSSKPEDVSKPGKRRGKYDEKTAKHQTGEQEAETNTEDLSRLHELNTEEKESEEPGAFPKASKPKIGFERRRKRPLPTEEKPPEKTPEEPVVKRKKGRPRKIRPVSEVQQAPKEAPEKQPTPKAAPEKQPTPKAAPEKEPAPKEAPEELPVVKDVSDDDETLEAARSRRRRKSLEQLDHSDAQEGDHHISGDEERQRNSTPEAEKTNEPPAMKALKKCPASKAAATAATPPSKKRVRRSSEDGETLSIHETVQEKAQSTSGLSDAVYHWLNELGLLKYSEHFEIHEVDDGVLPLLTFDDLREMGISAVGTRRKMFASIQDMGKKTQDA